MCLICVEYNMKRMTRDEVRKALPEMVLFAKTEEDRNHFKKLQSLGESNDEKLLQDFIDNHVSKYGKKIS
jgi:hypothetical protein